MNRVLSNTFQSQQASLSNGNILPEASRIEIDPENVEQQFTKKLMSRKMRDCHFKFFDKKSTTKLSFPIVTKQNPKKKPLPFRNTKCLHPSCLYDIKELLERYRSSMYSSYLAFVCNSCSRTINIDDFVLDRTLQEIIERVWSEFNRPDNVVCSSVTIQRDGTWTPNLPPYLANLISTLKNKVGSSPSQNAEYKIQAVPPEGPLTKQKQRRFVPPFLSFSKQEFISLEETYDNERLRKNDVIEKSLDILVRAVDYSNLRQGHSVSEIIIAFFLRYLEALHLQSKHRSSPSKKQKNRWVYTLFSVKSFDHSTRKARLNYLGNFFNQFKSDPKSIYENYDRLGVVLSYDDRWMGMLVNLRKHSMHLIDFMTTELSKFSEVSLLEDVSTIIKREFSLYSGNKSVVPTKKVEYYCDCGLEVMFFMLKAMDSQNPETERISFSELDTFKKQVCWGILRLRYSKNKEKEEDFLEFESETPKSLSRQSSQKQPLSPIKKKETRKKKPEPPPPPVQLVPPPPPPPTPPPPPPPKPVMVDMAIQLTDRSVESPKVPSKKPSVVLPPLNQNKSRVSLNSSSKFTEKPKNDKGLDDSILKDINLSDISLLHKSRLEENRVPSRSKTKRMLLPPLQTHERSQQLAETNGKTKSRPETKDSDITIEKEELAQILFNFKSQLINELKAKIPSNSGPNFNPNQTNQQTGRNRKNTMSSASIGPRSVNNLPQDDEEIHLTKAELKELLEKHKEKYLEELEMKALENQEESSDEDSSDDEFVNELGEKLPDNHPEVIKYKQEREKEKNKKKQKKPKNEIDMGKILLMASANPALAEKMIENEMMKLNMQNGMGYGSPPSGNHRKRKGRGESDESEEDESEDEGQSTENQEKEDGETQSKEEDEEKEESGNDDEGSKEESENKSEENSENDSEEKSGENSDEEEDDE